MSNLPTWSQAVATTPRHKRRLANSAAPDKMAVAKEGDDALTIGTVAKVKRTAFQWEVYAKPLKDGSKARPKVVATGRCRTLLAGISRVRFEAAKLASPNTAA